MSEDDGPNFSYAFASSSPSIPAPSWNPALRPDHESPVKTSFDHPLAAKSSPPLPPQDAAQDEDEEDELPSGPLPVQESEVVQRMMAKDEIPQSDDDFFDRYGRPESMQFAPASMPSFAETEEEGAPHEQGDESSRDIGAEEGASEVNGASRQEDVDAIAAKHAFLPEAEEETKESEPEQMYEHQGESGGLDDSMQESAEAPLVAEVQGAEWGESAADDWQIGEQDAEADVQGDAFDFEAGDEEAFESIVQQEPQQPDMATAVFSTDESALPTRDAHLASDTATTAQVQPMEGTMDEQEAVPLAAQESTQDEWGAQGDDSAFDFGADEAEEAFPDFTTSAPAGVDAPLAEDLADAWAAAMGDDEGLLDADATAAFGFDIDEDGLLDDAATAGVVGAAAGAAGAAVIANRHKRSASTTKYTPANVPQAGLPPPSRTASYRPEPQFVDLSQRVPAMQQHPATQRQPSNISPYASAYNQPAPPQARPQVSSAESFADKAKGGYHSPYDLPDDLAVKRRRPIAHPSAQASMPNLQQGGGAAPPPRLSSRTGPPPPAMGQSPVTPSAPAFPVQQSPAQPAKPPSRDGGFFAELDMPERPRRMGTPGRTYSPQIGAAPSLAPPAQIRPASTSYAPPQAQVPAQQQTYPSPAQQQVPSGGDPTAFPQLRPAERMPLYEDVQAARPEQVRSSTMPVPVQSSARYSPAPPPGGVPAPSKSPYAAAPPPSQGPGAPPPVANTSRYSPAPGAKPLPRQASASEPVSRAQAQLYAPRTSSPLAQRESPSHAAEVPPPAAKQASLNRMGSVASISGLETVNENAEPTFSPPSRPDAPRHAQQMSSGSSTPPQPGSQVSSPRKRANYAPPSNVYAPMGEGIIPPRRSQTSSPSRGAGKMPHTLPLANLDRPASVAGMQSPIRTSFANAAPTTTRVPNRVVSSGLGGPAYHDMPNLLPPANETAQDPLQRWKGAPVFSWGNGNAILTTFPRYTPMYQAGASVVRPVPGDIKTSTLSAACPQTEIFLRFPGPLKKSKKKEVLAWVRASAEELEKEHKGKSMNGELNSAAHTRSEERILLWKITALLVEHDGLLEGSPAVENAVRALLTLESPDPVSATEEPSPNKAEPEPFDPMAVRALRTHLYAGEREKAVWAAVDQRLWAHALLIASTLNDREIWKQVVQEFVRKEVRRSGGENSEALAALYQVFAGNWEESIDELVSVSARSGFQMVSTTGNAGTKDALAGLDRWRETLLLILNNRSVGDAAALASLGNLLNGYGRVEAGHICFLFARQAARFGGADNPESHFSLLGGHKSTEGSELGVSLDTVLLSEVYEFALLSSNQIAQPIPHLQAYKLYHAEVLAESGKRTEAQQYCDAITGIVTAKANRNTYYNAQLLRWLDDFSQRLSKAPASRGDGTGWKPSMDKVSSSIWGKFNTFIAGQDDETPGPSGAEGMPEGGGASQFVPMGMPSMPQRAVSSSEVPLYGGYTPQQPQVNGAPIGGGGGRYAPGAQTQPQTQGQGAYTPRSSSEQGRPKYTAQSQSAYEPRSSNEFGSPYAPQAQQSPYAPSSQQGHGVHSPYAPQEQTQTQGLGFQPGVASPSYLPTPPLEQGGMGMNGYAPEPHAQSEPEAPTQSYGYEPSASYEPASYSPDQPDEPAAEVEADGEEKPQKKKGFMDDDEEDDELAKRAAALKKAQKSEADRLADEAFRKAAEADAAKGKNPPANHAQKASWFGGWFGKKQPDPNMPTVHKAKLGEESSFVFDKELGRWVNKKAGAEQAAPVAATPPPPRASGPPSRPASGMHAPPPPATGAGTPPINKAGSPAPPSSSGSMGPPAPIQRSASAQPPLAGPVAALAGSGPPSRPPSRPSTSMSNASDIDDLLGPATGGPRKPAAKKGRKGRYVDVMAQK